MARMDGFTGNEALVPLEQHLEGLLRSRNRGLIRLDRMRRRADQSDERPEP